LAIAALLILASRLGAADTPGSPPALLRAEFINDHAPYRSSHASTIVETTGHELVAAWFGGTGEGNPDVGIWLSRFVDGHWTPSVEVANGVQHAGKRYPTWNPVLFQPRDGPLLLFYKAGPSPSGWWGMLTTSTDGGKTWSEPRRLPEDVLGPIKNKPVQLADGSLLCSSSVEIPRGPWRVHFERTPDLGRTWQIVPVPEGEPAFNAIQPSVLFYADGRMQALCRTQEGVLGQTWSADGGKTWTAVTATNLPNPNSGTDAITLADGRQLLVYNHSRPPEGRRGGGPRYPLNVAISRDGTQWQQVLTLEDAPVRNGYAYPAVIQAADGRVHITYTWNREKIKHVVIDPAKL
jgi:predicted neuraminidase